jgi:hypothetical protein
MMWYPKHNRLAGKSLHPIDLQVKAETPGAVEGIACVSFVPHGFCDGRRGWTAISDQALIGFADGMEMAKIMQDLLPAGRDAMARDIAGH